MKLILVRHGETDWNVGVGKVQGRTDVPLNENGKKQKEECAKKFLGKKIDCIYSSPLSRAYDTALSIQKVVKCPLKKEPELMEQSFGIYEGRLRTDKEYQECRRNYFKRFENGESFCDVVARIYSLLKRIKENHSDSETVVVVTHNGVARVVNSYFESVSNEEFVSFAMCNCEIREYIL